MKQKKEKIKKCKEMQFACTAVSCRANKRKKKKNKDCRLLSEKEKKKLPDYVKGFADGIKHQKTNCCCVPD